MDQSLPKAIEVAFAKAACMELGKAASTAFGAEFQKPALFLTSI